MVFFAVTFKILCVSLALGFAVSIIFFVPLTIYVIPYLLWVGTQNTKGKYRELSDVTNCFKVARNATALYKSWILHSTPVFK